MKAIAILLALAGATAANANCVQVGGYTTCVDANGGSYNSSRVGPITSTYGTTGNGTSWSQSGVVVGNTHSYNGQASNGSNWNGTSQRIGPITTNNGYMSPPTMQPLRPCIGYGC